MASPEQPQSFCSLIPRQYGELIVLVNCFVIVSLLHTHAHEQL